MPGRGSAPPPRAITCWSAATSRPASWPFTTATCPEGQLLTKTRLIRAAGLRWPAEEDFGFGKDCFGLDQSQVRLYTAIARHTVLVMAALAICAVTAALLARPHRYPGPAPGHARSAAPRRNPG